MVIVAGMDALTGLALEAQAGDRRALDELVGAAYGQVWRFCAGFVDEQSAEDLAQETFVRAVRGLSGFRADASALSWLLGIARHACLDELRGRSRRRQRDATLASRPGLARSAGTDASQESTVADLYRRLEPERRAAFVLTQLLGLSYGETARVCECATGTIRSRVARARADLIALLGDGRSGSTTRRERGGAAPA